MARGRKAKGLGDTIEKVTKATGIKAIVDKVSEVTGIDCKCDARKEALNKLWTYKKVECINETDMKYLDNFFEKNHYQLSIKQQTELKSIYKNIFNVSLEDTSCSSCWRDYISQIRQVYDTQTNE
jgi:hypothetical protein